MRVANHHPVVLVVLMLLITSFHSQIIVKAESEDCERGLSCDWIKTDSSSNLVVIQEITAIWCEICAETDTTIEEFTNQRHQEVVRIAYHPDDGLDYLGNRLSTRQMWNLGENPTEAQFPTIWVDGGNKATGPVTNDQLQRTYLKASGQRNSEDTIQVEYFNRAINLSGDTQNRLEFITTITGGNSDKITLILKENNVEIDNPDAYNGITHHNDVAKAGVMINYDNGTIIFAEPDGAWEIIDWERNGNISKFEIFYNYNLSSNPEDDEMMDQKGVVVFSENSDGKIIAAQKLGSTNKNVNYDNGSIIIITSVGIIGIIIATSTLNRLKDSKSDNVMIDDAESEE